MQADACEDGDRQAGGEGEDDDEFAPERHLQAVDERDGEGEEDCFEGDVEGCYEGPAGQLSLLVCGFVVGGEILTSPLQLFEGTPHGPFTWQSTARRNIEMTTHAAVRPIVAHSRFRWSARGVRRRWIPAVQAFDSPTDTSQKTWPAVSA